MENMKPLFITFTGLDERTDFARVQELSSAYSIEWGVLFSQSRQGQEPRYPDSDTITKIRDVPVLKAAHLCGEYARMVQRGEVLNLDLSGYSRAQINTHDPDFAAIEQFGKTCAVQTIAQHRTLIFPDSGEVQLLFDRSGGKGESPKEWPQNPGRMVGYAGGISPETIDDVLNGIDRRGYFWLDMESGIRTDDWLDLDKCEAICKKVYA